MIDGSYLQHELKNEEKCNMSSLLFCIKSQAAQIFFVTSEIASDNFLKISFLLKFYLFSALYIGN